MNSNKYENQEQTDEAEKHFTLPESRHFDEGEIPTVENCCKL